MGEACSVYEERHVQGFGGKTCGKEATWDTPGVDVRIIFRWIFKIWIGFIWLRIEIGGGHL
jgi:hypothetical protein